MEVIHEAGASHFIFTSNKLFTNNNYYFTISMSGRMLGALDTLSNFILIIAFTLVVLSGLLLTSSQFLR